MDIGEVVFIISRLALGALACFFAILLWAKTRDIVWMFMVIGVIASYVETVYAVLGIFGIVARGFITIGNVPLLSMVLPNLPMLFFLAGFVVMVFRKYRVGV